MPFDHIICLTSHCSLRWAGTLFIHLNVFLPLHIISTWKSWLFYAFWHLTLQPTLYSLIENRHWLVDFIYGRWFKYNWIEEKNEVKTVLYTHLSLEDILPYFVWCLCWTFGLAKRYFNLMYFILCISYTLASAFVLLVLTLNMIQVQCVCFSIFVSKNRFELSILKSVTHRFSVYA